MTILVSLTTVLGFVTGCVKTLSAAGDMNSPRGRRDVGTGESLHSVGLDRCLLAISTFVVVGLSRRNVNGDATAVDQHHV